MSLVRFGVSLEKALLQKFDELSRQKNYNNRSEAIRDLIRDRLVKKEWSASGGKVIAVITLVYDHHKRKLVDSLVCIQHHHEADILASQHIHLDHINCLEVIVARGSAKDIEDLAARLRSAKGVKHGELVMTTTGSGLK